MCWCCGGWRAHRDSETGAYETRRATALRAMEILKSGSHAAR